MSEFSKRERQNIMLEELRELNRKGYISNEAYHKVLQGQHNYIVAMEKTTDAPEQDDPVSTPVKPKKPITTAKLSKEKSQQVEQTKEQTPTPQKKRLSEQEIRDRNITWSLSIAVILLIIGGTALATNTWDIMSNWMKTGMIALVAGLFFGLAFVTERMLNIKKTAFAFYVLGSLFLPIVYLSIGFFEQMGTYLSFYGEGRYLYGAIGSFILFPVYLMLAFKLRARLFVWISYIVVTLCAGFLLAWFNVPVDGFYLGIMVFNSLLILGYRYLRQSKRKSLKLMTDELPLYIQVSLILSTLLMITFYSDQVFHGFNLLLTALIYFAMIYVSNHKQYHFVFSLMLVYGAYQLIEFTALHHIGAIGYALLGFIFLSIPKLIEDKYQMDKIFRYTSAIVSGCAFIFISVQGIVIRMDDPSLVLLAAYLIIALNFLYLSYTSKTRHVLFDYLSPLFLISALFEGVRIGQDLSFYNTLVLPMFFGAFVLYILLGCLMKHNFFQSIKASSRDVTALVMLISLFIDLTLFNWWQSGVMLLALSAIALLMIRFETRSFISTTGVATWIHPVTLGFAVVMFYTEMQLPNMSEFREDMVNFDSLSLIYGSIIVLLVSYLWKRVKQEKLYNHAFFVAQGFYLIGMLDTLQSLNMSLQPTTQAIIMFGGIVMAYLLYLKTKWLATPYVVSIVSLIFYMTVLMVIHDKLVIYSSLFMSLQLPVGGLLLLSVGLFLKKMDVKLAKAFIWVGHIYYPLAFIVSLDYGDTSIWSTVLATLMYGASVFLAKKEWQIKTFLYAGFTTFWLFIMIMFRVMNLHEYMHYGWLTTSIILTAGWVLSSPIWRARITYYLLPFSLIGAASFMFVTPFDLTLFIVTLVYIILILVLLHRVKWDVFTILPLALTFIAVMNYSTYHPGIEYALFLILVIMFMSFALLFYSVIYQEGKKQFPIIDWYTLTGFVALFSLYLFADDSLWQKLLPGILIAASIYAQQHRVSFIAPHWLLFAAVAYILQPYYAFLGHIDIPELIEAECYVLPWIALAIFLKRLSGEKYRQQMNYVQWAVLVVVSLILIQDALASNTVYDALIIGSLALASLIGGMIYQQKSFFFVGAGVLLLNVFLQTRPFWGALPWWAYLLIAGALLITVASYNEWHKQKTSKGKETLISKFNKKIIERIKRWD